MKKILLLIFAFLLTGCSSYNITLEINKNKSMDFSVIILSDDNTIDFSSTISSYNKKLEEYGYFVSKYTKDNKQGIVISKHFDNIDDISKGKRSEEFNLLYFYNNDYSSDVESKMFNIDKSFDSNRYAANFYVDLSNLNIDINNSSVIFKVFVPNGTESNNAGDVSYDGNELTWNITSLGKTEIDFVFSLKSYDYIYYGVAVLIILFLVFSIFGNLFTKSGDNNENVVEGATNAANYDIDKKIENITKNANKNIASSYNNVVNSEFNNNVVPPQSGNVNYNNSVGSNTVDMDNIQKNIKSQSSFNNSSNVNVLVPEIGMTNFKAPVQEKKKSLFGKLSKKNNTKKSDDDKSISSGSSINFDNSFSAMVDSISNNNNNTQFSDSTISVNSQITQVDKNISKQILGDNSSISVLGGENINIENITDSNNTGIEFKNNPNVDINNVLSNSSSVDSFQYFDEGNNVDVVEEKESEKKDSEEIVINVNNSSFVVENNNKKDL